ncbi:MAG: UDP-N-acetylmuramoyl-tripeptide--D-alanyl-D-alanine ligase [Treponema sp.]|jgi:UDP-N-acetylmuramoyl-tripeptide--D-alanyl-D-alanine ligase|nr:UDP-N-acetylmuramoyl-tripeptide--D-alanyl-D-alanine ligase [Treponema sp.]
MLMTFEELRTALDALFYSGKKKITDTILTDGFSACCVDSRKAVQDSLFFALEGERDDGHRFVNAAFAGGAVGAVVSKGKVEALKPCADSYGASLFAVDNTLKALQSVAGAYLAKFPNLLKIGITGSSGKTTVKEITACIFAGEKGWEKVVMNRGNLNSETGLPLSVFEVGPDHVVGVFEMGMNRKGEIAELAQVLKPNIALITNIGTAHIGTLGGKNAIAAEKKEIFSLFTGKETALIPNSDEYRDFLAEGVKGKVVFYESHSEFMREEKSQIIDRGLYGYDIMWNGNWVRFKLPGRHNIKNAIAALAIAKEAGVSNESIEQGLEKVAPLFGRGQIIYGDVTVVHDCYNANPESMSAVINFCDTLTWDGRKIYVIGSMLELGEESKKAHESIGAVLDDSAADFVYLFGKETETIARILKKNGKKPFFFTENMQELTQAFKSFTQTGDLVLLKGSRGCALERLLNSE